MIILLKAILIGFITGIGISIPLGPSGIESINRTLSYNYREGLKVSLGAIAADISYLIVINCGLFKLFHKNKLTESFFWIISGLILAVIGYRTIHKIEKKTDVKKVSAVSSYAFLSGFVITLTNPMTPTMWLGLSGTVLLIWRKIGKFYYYMFILSIIAGMVTWFSLLNFLALKGFKVLTPNSSNGVSKFIRWSIVFLGVAFILFGLGKFLFFLFRRCF